MLSPQEELAVNAAVELAARYLDAAVDTTWNGFRRRRERRAAESGELFRAYYARMVAKCATTKTLLNPRNPVMLSDFYVSLDLDASNEILSNVTVDDLFRVGPSLLITGGAGTGKSTLMKYLFLDAIRRGTGIPLFVELRHFSEFDGPFVDFLYATTSESGLSVSATVFEQLLKERRFILFLDGFDEVTHRRAGKLALQIERFDSNRDNLRTIVTSRPDYYRFVGWNGFREVTVKPLTKRQSLMLIERVQYDELVKRTFGQAVDQRLYTSHTSFLENPLLTTLMLLTFEQFGTVDARMHLFYGQAYETLYAKHDATKIGFRRELHSALPGDEFRAAVAAFSIQSYLDGAVSFSDDRALHYASRIPEMISITGTFSAREFVGDLTSSVCLLVQDGLELRFTHRSFQEYFAAIFCLYFARAHRRPLLRLIRHRMNADTTAVLMLAMDRLAFEEDFLKPSIEELRLFFRWRASMEATDDVLNFLREHVHISVRAEGLSVQLVTDDAVANVEVVRFIERHYYQRDFLWHTDEQEVIRGFRAAVVAARVREFAAERHLSTSAALAYAESLPSLPVRDTDYADDRLRTLIQKAFAPVAASVDRAVLLFARIDDEHNRRDAAIESLLKRDPSSG